MSCKQCENYQRKILRAIDYVSVIQDQITGQLAINQDILDSCKIILDQPSGIPRGKWSYTKATRDRTRQNNKNLWDNYEALSHLVALLTY